MNKNGNPCGYWLDFFMLMVKGNFNAASGTMEDDERDFLALRLATYQKMHLTPLEKHLFTPGKRLATVETDLGRFGLLVCWDMAFPELSRLLAMQGADVLLAPSAWEVPHEWSYRQMAAARALDNVVFVATCNHTGRAGKLNFFGRSAIYRPDGRLLNEAKQEDSRIVVAEIDLDVRQQLQDAFYSMWRDRRGDLYDLKWKGTNTP